MAISWIAKITGILLDPLSFPENFIKIQNFLRHRHAARAGRETRPKKIIEINKILKINYMVVLF